MHESPNSLQPTAYHPASIVMLVGIGNNDRGSAKLFSDAGRVVLIQDAYIEHIEVWEKGQRVFSGPETRIASSRFLSEITFGLPGILRNIRNYRRHMANKPCDVIITSAYGQTFAGLFLRAMGKTRKVVCILSDFLPPQGSLAVRCHRRITGLLTSLAARFSDEVWGVSPRIPTLNANPHHYVLPLFVDDNHAPTDIRDEVGYIGFPSPDHALDILFDICRKHDLKLNVFGDSPYLQSIKHLAPARTVFHGITNDSSKINGVLSRCFCGYAVYRNCSPNSYSYYGIPSKTLQFFASNTPVVTTNTAHFSQNISRFQVGHVVEPIPEQIETAILDLKTHFHVYSEAINQFRQTWNKDVEHFHHTRIAELLAKP